MDYLTYTHDETILHTEYQITYINGIYTKSKIEQTNNHEVGVKVYIDMKLPLILSPLTWLKYELSEEMIREILTLEMRQNTHYLWQIALVILHDRLNLYNANKLILPSTTDVYRSFKFTKNPDIVTKLIGFYKDILTQHLKTKELYYTRKTEQLVNINPYGTTYLPIVKIDHNVIKHAEKCIHDTIPSPMNADLSFPLFELFPESAYVPIKSHRMNNGLYCIEMRKVIPVETYLNRPCQSKSCTISVPCQVLVEEKPFVFVNEGCLIMSDI